MTLKLQPTPTFWHAVPITIPGASQPALVDFEFKHQTKEKLADFVLRLHADDGRPDETILGEVISNWKGVDAEFSPSALRDLLSNYPASALEILRGYLAGLTESRRKN